MRHPEDGARVGGDTKVDAIMATLVVAVRPSDTIERVTERVLAEGISSVPVLDEGGHPVGLLSRLDLLRAAGLGRALTAEELMPGAVHAIHHEGSVALAAATMAELGVHHLIVVDEESVAVGMLSSLDLVRWLAEAAGYGLE